MVAHIVNRRKEKSDNERFIEALALVEDYQLSGTVDWIFYQLIPDQVEIIRQQGIANNAEVIERLCLKDKTLIIEVVEAAFLGLQPIIPCKKQ